MGTAVSRAERQSARMSKITNDWLNPVWHRMLYSCIRITTVGVRGLSNPVKSVMGNLLHVSYWYIPHYHELN